MKMTDSAKKLPKNFQISDVHNFCNIPMLQCFQVGHTLKSLATPDTVALPAEQTPAAQRPGVDARWYVPVGVRW